MPEANPKRRFSQFHLSTAITLMFILGSLLLANLRSTDQRLMPGDGGLGIHDILRQSDFGWPCRACIIVENTGLGGTMSAAGALVPLPNSKPMPEPGAGTLILRDWIAGGMAIDVIVAIMALFIGTLACESLIRRREAPKP